MNTRISPFSKKSYLHRAQWRYYFHLSHERILVSPWLLTWLANYKRTSRSRARRVLFEISFTKCPKWLRGANTVELLVTFWTSCQIWNIKYTYNCLYFSFITLYPSFITFLWQAFYDGWPIQLHCFAVSKMNKKCCVRFAHLWEILSALEDKNRIPARPCNVLNICAVVYRQHSNPNRFLQYLEELVEETLHPQRDFKLDLLKI